MLDTRFDWVLEKRGQRYQARDLVGRGTGWFDTPDEALRALGLIMQRGRRYLQTLVWRSGQDNQLRRPMRKPKRRGGRRVRVPRW